MKKIMIIDGGPRKNMNTAAMIEAFANGAKSVSEDIEVKVFRVYDVDLSAVLRGERTIVQMGSELVDIVAEVASGRMTKAEAFGFSDIAVDHVCRFV